MGAWGRGPTATDRATGGSRCAGVDASLAAATGGCLRRQLRLGAGNCYYAVVLVACITWHARDTTREKMP